MGRVASFLVDRLGWRSQIEPFLEKRISGDLNWSFTLGGVCALLVLVEALTGMILALYYNPSPEHAYESINFIMTDLAGGRVIRGLHHWGAGALVVLALAHLTTSFFYGAYKAPREMTWVVGVGLLLLILAFGFTGYLLPWDQKAYWATVVGTNVAGDIPLVGRWLVRILRGGPEVSGLTLTRFYAVHTLLLPALTVGSIVVHIYLVRLHDVAGHWDPAHPGKAKAARFFPDFILKDALAFALVFAAILGLALLVEPPLEAKALTPDPAYLPRPEWYYLWFFKLLTYFSGQAEALGTLIIPLGGLALLLLLPFLNRRPDRSPAARPLALAGGAAALAGIVFLSVMGLADSRPYGQAVVLPDRPLTAAEAGGVKLWVEKDCGYCHQVLGRGGRREGPDLSNVIPKGRTKAGLVKSIRDPQAASPWSVMPKYDLTTEELDSLADFLLSLDFGRHDPKIASREDVLGGKVP